MLAPHLLVALCTLIFLASFIDSIAGGGGLISLPAYLFVGLPVHNAMACNKFSSSIGTTISAIRFLKSKAIELKVAVISAIGSFLASFIASEIVLLIDDKILKTVFITVLPIVAIFILSKRNLGDENNFSSISNKKVPIFSFIIGLFMGFYDGLIGPGTGTFAIIAYSTIMKFDLKTASGNAKLLNLASNYASLAVFFLSGKVLYQIAIPAAIASLIGSYLGSGFAIKKGAKFIRPMMLLVIILLFSKIFLDVFGGIFLK